MNLIWMLFASSCYLSDVHVYEPEYSGYNVHKICFFGENKGINASIEMCFEMPLDLIFEMQEGEI